MSDPVTNFVISFFGRLVFSIFQFFNKSLTKKLFPIKQNLLILSFPGHLTGLIDRQSNTSHLDLFLHLDNRNYYDMLITGASINLFVGTDKILSRDKLLHFFCQSGKSVDQKISLDLEHLEIYKLISIFGQTGEKSASIYLDLFFEIKTGRESFRYEVLDQRLNTCIVPLPNDLIDRANRLL